MQLGLLEVSGTGKPTKNALMRALWLSFGFSDKQPGTTLRILHF